MEKRDYKVYDGIINYQIYNEKIFMGDTAKGFFFRVFNQKGEKLYDIKVEYEKRKFTEEDKTNFLNSIKKSKYYERNKDRIMYKFPEYFPAYRLFYITSGKIYVFTYKKRDKMRELIILDLRGNVLKTTFFDYKNMSTIYNDRFYYLKENEEEEEWELFVEDIQ
jgi:hypothetical protein